MGKIKGNESKQELSPKVLQLYQAVIELVIENNDVTTVKVSDITERAGIGKGTAYDYFDTKEELIVNGILFYTKDLFSQINRQTNEKESFSEKVLYLLQCIEEKMAEGQCFLKFANLWFGTSPISIKLKEMMEEHISEYTPMGMLEKVLQEGVEKGEVTNELPMSYMLLTLISKLWGYALGIKMKQRPEDWDQEKVKQLIHKSIICELAKK